MPHHCQGARIRCVLFDFVAFCPCEELLSQGAAVAGEVTPCLGVNPSNPRTSSIWSPWRPVGVLKSKTVSSPCQAHNLLSFQALHGRIMSRYSEVLSFLLEAMELESSACGGNPAVRNAEYNSSRKSFQAASEKCGIMYAETACRS